MTKEKNGRKVLVNDRRTKSIHAFADISMDNSYQQTKGKARKEEGDIAKKIAKTLQEELQYVRELDFI